MIKQILKRIVCHSFLGEKKLRFARTAISNKKLPPRFRKCFEQIKNYLPRLVVQARISISRDVEAVYELNLQCNGDRQIYFGTYEKETVRFIKKILQFKTCIWDIGSNIGFYVVIAALLLKERGKVYAFEPVPVNFRALQTNVKLNKLENVEVFNVALSSENGEATIYALDIEKVTSSPTLNEKWARSSGLEKCITIETKNAMQLFSEGRIDRPDLIKIDAETHEPIILTTLLPILTEDQAPDIITEIMPPTIGTIKSLLIDKCGYNCYHICPAGIRFVNELKMRRPYNDYFFTKKTKKILEC
jgi:FkbM family methyltransferase